MFRLKAGRSFVTHESAPRPHVGVWTAYTYTPQGQLETVTTITSSVSSVQSVVSYSYLPGTDLLTGWTQSGTGILPVTHTRTYEPNRTLITGIENTHGTDLISSFAYTNDELGRRTERVDLTPALPSVTNTFRKGVSHCILLFWGG